MKAIKNLLTNEAFLGTVALTILGSLALIFNHIEIAGVAIGGIAAMLRGAKGETE